MDLTLYHWTPIDVAAANSVDRPRQYFTPYQIHKDKFDGDVTGYKAGDQLLISANDSENRLKFVTDRFGEDSDWAEITDDVFAQFKAGGGSTLRELFLFLKKTNVLGKLHEFPWSGTYAHANYAADTLDYIDNSAFRCAVLTEAAAHDAEKASQARYVFDNWSAIPAQASDGTRLKKVRIAPPLFQTLSGNPGDNHVTLANPRIMRLREHIAALRRRAKLICQLSAQIQIEMRDRLGLVVRVRQAALLLDIGGMRVSAPDARERLAAAQGAMRALRETIHTDALEHPLGDHSTLTYGAFLSWPTAIGDLGDQIRYILFNPDDSRDVPPCTPTNLPFHDFAGFTSLCREVFADALDAGAMEEYAIRSTLELLLDAMTWCTDALCECQGTEEMAQIPKLICANAPPKPAETSADLDYPKQLYRLALSIIGPKVRFPTGEVLLPPQYPEAEAQQLQGGSLLLALQAVVAAWNVPTAASSADKMAQLAEEILTSCDKALEAPKAKDVRDWYSAKNAKSVGKLVKRLYSALEAAAGHLKGSPAPKLPTGEEPPLQGINWVQEGKFAPVEPAEVPARGPLKLIIATLGLAMSIAGTADDLSKGAHEESVVARAKAIVSVTGGLVAVAEVSALGFEQITKGLADLSKLATESAAIAKWLGRASAILGLISAAIDLFMTYDKGGDDIEKLGAWLSLGGAAAAGLSSFLAAGVWATGLGWLGLAAILVGFLIEVLSSSDAHMAPNAVVVAILENLRRERTFVQLSSATGSELGAKLDALVAATTPLNLPLIKWHDGRGALSAAHISETVINLVCESVSSTPGEMSPQTAL